MAPGGSPLAAKPAPPPPDPIDPTEAEDGDLPPDASTERLQ